MSKVENADPNKITKTYKFFSEDLTYQERTVNVDFVPAADYQSAVERLGSNAEVILAALNSALKEKALSDARAEVKASGISTKAVMTFIRPFREVPPYSGIKDRQKQTEAILAKVKETPFMLDAIKAAAAQDNSDGDGDGDNQN